MTARRLVSHLVPAILLAATASAAQAQWNATRTLDGYYTQYRLDGGTADDPHTVLDGVGARLTWGPALDPAASGIAARSAAGFFASYAPAQGNLGVSTLHAGTLLDIQPFRTPLAGRIDPVLSLGVGALRTKVDRPGAENAALTDRTNTTLALSPGVGARIGLWQGLDLRADVHDVMTFRRATRHNVAVNVGLGLAF